MVDSWREGGGDGYGGVALPSLTPVVKRLVIANLGIYGITLLLNLSSPAAQSGLYQWVGLNTRLWADWFPFLPVWQPLTYGFFHGMNPWHVLWNMLLLYFFGTMLEGILGPRRFLLTYLACMLGGAALHLVLALYPPMRANAVGASGAVLGVVAVLATLRPHTRVIVLFIPLTLKVLAIGIFAIDLIFLLQSSRGSVSGVAHSVHVGGFLFGFVAARQRWIWQDPVAGVHKKLARSRARRQAEDEQRMDELLAKIHREGMSSLSRSERSFLKRVAGKR